ncbi:CvpA family protein [Flammeovirgaceae bacterium SG7u.111]|nr:CvpA family protein [Flammeovirgaceae bacterium SG7u.132]WPO35337.1 CvpA family protein [Flammeovirgaceae bacterium SG7u.111]
MESYFSSYIRVVDLVLAFFIIWGAYKGYQKGFLVELISIVVFVAGVILIFFAIANVFMSADKALDMNSPRIAKFGFYVLFFVLGSLALNKMTRAIQNKIDYSIFDSFDNFAAMVLGGLKYAVFLSIFLGLLDAAGLRLPKDITDDTKIYPMLLDFQIWLVETGKILSPSIGELYDDIRAMLDPKGA